MDKDRDYDAILEQLNQIKKILESMHTTATDIQAKGNKTNNVLQDLVGEKVGSKVENFGRKIADIVAQGEARVRELTVQVENEKEQAKKIQTMADQLDQGR